MQLNELKSFLAVVRTRSFSLAAQQMHITQPAMSKRIQALEQPLGSRLFDRIGKQVHLTEAGQLLVAKAEAMLSLGSDIERDIANLSLTVSGRLKIATSHHIGLHRLEPVLRSYNLQYPNVELDIQFEDSEVAANMVRAGEIELAVATLNPAHLAQSQTRAATGGLAQELLATPIWHDPLVFVCAPDSQAFDDAPVGLTALAQSPCILPGLGTYTGRLVVDRFSAAGLPLNPRMSTNYLETIRMLVSVGLGWSVLPQTMVAGMRVLDVQCQPIARTLGYMTHRARSLSNSAIAFLAVLDDYCSSPSEVGAEKSQTE